VEIVLGEAEREQLESWTRRRTSAQALAQRSRIVLLAADGLTNTEIAQQLGVGRPMVTKRRSQFAVERLDGLVDEPRPGQPRLTTHPRFVVHFTPTSSSWLNLVERWFEELTTKKPRRATHRSVRARNTDIRDWISTWNDNPKPFVWTKTADEILESVARYCTRINESRH